MGMIYKYSGVSYGGEYKRGIIEVDSSEDLIKRIKSEKELVTIINLKRQLRGRAINVKILEAVEKRIEKIINRFIRTADEEDSNWAVRYNRVRQKMARHGWEVRSKVLSKMRKKKVTIDKDIYDKLVNFLNSKEISDRLAGMSSIGAGIGEGTSSGGIDREGGSRGVSEEGEDKGRRARGGEEIRSRISEKRLESVLGQTDYIDMGHYIENKRDMFEDDEDEREIDWSLIDNIQKDTVKRQYKRKVKEKEIILFTKRLQIMLESGVSLVNSLILLAKTKNVVFAKMVEDIIDSIQNGNTFSWGLSRYPGQFDHVYVSLVSIGETLGNLGGILLDIIDSKEQKQKLDRKVRTASLYPSLIGVVIVAVLVLGSVFFIPAFEKLFVDNEVDMPKITSIVFSIARSMPGILLGCAVVVVVFNLFIRISKKFRMGYISIRDKVALKIPILKETIQILNMYNFSSTVALMLKNAIRLNDAVLLASKTVNNVHIRKEVYNVSTLLVQGFSLTESLELQEHFDDIMVNMTLTGEESGQLSFALHQVAKYYKEELDKYIERVIELVQPISIFLIAMIAVPVIFAIYMPVLEMTSGGGLGF